jgi:Uma2 family endonuclease
MAVQTRITAAEYYQLPQYTEHSLIQLIDGEVVIGMPPIPLHQRIVVKLIALLLNYETRYGGQIYTAPIEVYLDEHNIFEPDVLYLTPETTCVVEEKRLVGAPDLVMEVLSPSTAKHDRERKFRAYEQHGVREYWIVDPSNAYLEVWALQGEKFAKTGTFVAGDTFTSAVLGEQPVTVSAIFEG